MVSVALRTLGVASWLVVVGAPHAQEGWARFRGPNGCGRAAEGPSYPVAFGPDQHVLWKQPVSAGHSSPCVVGDCVVLTGATEDALETLCFGREHGVLRWRRTVPLAKAEKHHQVNGLATPTPTADAERVYVSFGSFGLICYDLAGDEVWRRELPAPNNTFGSASSPIVVGDALVFVRDTNDESYLERIDAATGAAQWRVDRSGFRSGWSTPVVWQRDGVTELLVYGAFRLTAYDFADGSELWSVPGLADEPCITPVLGADMVFVTSYNMRTNPEVIGLPTFAELLAAHDADGDGTLSREETKDNVSILSRLDADGEGDHPLRGFFSFLDRDRDGQLTEPEWGKMRAWLGSFEHANALVAIRPGADGEAEIVWHQPHGVPECPSPLLLDGRVYLFKNGGMASCVDAQTGEAKFRERLGARGPRYASPVAGGGRIYTASARGVVTVLEPGDTLRVLQHNDLGERIMATPALVDGVIYLRTEEHLYAFGDA
ncbi:MAG: PQQ-binding-like beta-propeller repeat protein [Planctomycetota bacterium]